MVRHDPGYIDKGTTAMTPAVAVATNVGSAVGMSDAEFVQFTLLATWDTTATGHTGTIKVQDSATGSGGWSDVGSTADITDDRNDWYVNVHAEAVRNFIRIGVVTTTGMLLIAASASKRLGSGHGATRPDLTIKT